MTGDGLALWLLITCTATGTGIVLWLLKLLIDAASDYAPATEHQPEPAPPVPARPIWPALPTPHAHTTACTGETLALTVQPSRARHAKPRTP
ncbi:hypothetical protein [Streptomyces caniscabiei]|uniref:hypothetical protein n=1 Tax=Streptomyces caniscabiei TaxID=2746961 RepID=UPI0019D66CD3|nr:hypothetical protein [Streptomyces caniscabiei]MBE4790967.1 hypothetical protein [Streptomyces caniscabiei]MDX3009594.1 hypothetical protein [Streptomyces caniscabiei]